MKNNKPLKAGIVTFLIAVLAFLSLLTARFLSLYSEEASGKKFSFLLGLRITGETAITMLPVILGTSVFIAGILAGRRYFRQREFAQQPLWITLILTCFLMFLLNAIAIPQMQSDILVLLYDMRNAEKAEVGEPTTGVEEAFKSVPQMMGPGGLSREMDSLSKRLERQKYNVAVTVSGYAGREQVKALLQTENAHVLGLTLNDFNGTDIQLADKPNDSFKMVQQLLDVYRYDHETMVANYRRFSEVYWEKILLPFAWLLMGITGFIIGYFFRNTRLWVPIVLSYFVFSWLTIIGEILAKNMWHKYAVYPPWNLWLFILMWLLIGGIAWLLMRRSQRNTAATT